jgi:2,3-bisphosphoglycerate-independent phosphoglycerate mutase
MNLGAGRVVLQDLPRIDADVASGRLAENPALGDFITAMKKNGGTVHLMGLLSPGGVHSHQKHMAALATLMAGVGISVIVHAFLDGRDTPPRSADGYMATFLDDVSGFEQITVGTVCGRYYAMDRDQRWDRVARGYAAIARGEGLAAADPLAAVSDGYAADENDEFVLPRVVAGYGGMANGDGLLMANFRADRAREILTALTDSDFDGFDREKPPQLSAALGMVQYSSALAKTMTALYPPDAVEGTIGEIVAAAGLRQLRIAETEKYAHVTFFFNGGEETVFEGEERILVPSPKVATYDLKPEMSAFEVCGELVAAIASGRFDFILVNFANGDMVGHTGILEAAVEAAQAVDACLGRLEAAVVEAGGVMLITADHGNAECMRDAGTGEPHTAHTMDDVPAVLVNAPARISALEAGCLADVAPTMLSLMGLAKPAAMSGLDLLRGDDETRQSA